jgi:hypothetical protein
MFKYEAAVSNVATAVFFGGSLVVYFRGFTLVWVGYFLAKAAVYAWVAHRYGMDTGVAVRIVVGNASFYALLGISILGGPTLFRALLRWGVFKQEDMVPLEPAVSAETPLTAGSTLP